MKQTDHDILRLAVPSIVSNITVPLLGLVDLAIAGHLGSERYIAAIAVGTMTFNFIYWLMGFLRMGTSGMTSQALGAGDQAGVALMLRRSVGVALAIAAALLALQVPLRWAALTAIHPSAQVWPLAADYFNIVVWGAPAMLALYSLNGWFVGVQTTKLPMVVAIFQNMVNIVASLTFVFLMGMKIEGIALGTLVAQWGGVLLAAWLARRKAEALRPAQQGAIPSRHTASKSEDGGHGGAHDAPQPPPDGFWRRFFTVNRDIFFRTLCLVTVSLLFTSAGARQGDMTLAINTLLMTFYTLFSYVMDGFAFAGEAMTGRLWGARDRSGLRALARRLTRHWGWSMAALFTLLYAVGGRRLLRLLTDDAAVVEAAQAYLPWAALIPACGVMAFVYDGIFIGLTATRGMLRSTFSAALTFVAISLPAMWLASPPLTNHLLWLAFLVYLATRGAVEWAYFREKAHAKA